MGVLPIFRLISEGQGQHFGCTKCVSPVFLVKVLCFSVVFARFRSECQHAVKKWQGVFRTFADM